MTVTNPEISNADDIDFDASSAVAEAESALLQAQQSHATEGLLGQYADQEDFQQDVITDPGLDKNLDPRQKLADQLKDVDPLEYYGQSLQNEGADEARAKIEITAAPEVDTAETRKLLLAKRVAKLETDLDELNKHYEGVVIMKPAASPEDTQQLSDTFNQRAPRGELINRRDYKDEETGREVIEYRYHVLDSSGQVNPREVVVERWDALNGQLIHNVLIRSEQATRRALLGRSEETISQRAMELLDAKAKVPKRSRLDDSSRYERGLASSGADAAGTYVMHPELASKLQGKELRWDKQGKLEVKEHKLGQKQRKGFIAKLFGLN